MLSKLADYFIPAQYQHPDEARRSARLLVFVLFYSGLGQLLSVSNGSLLGFPEISYLLMAGSLVCGLLLFAFRGGLSLAACLNLTIASHAVLFATQAYWGGGIESPGVSSLFFLPALAMLISGRRSAIFWLVVCLGITIGFFAHEQLVGQMPIHYDPTRRDLYFFLSIVGQILVLFFITLAFNDEKNRAINGLIQKNEELVAVQNQLIQQEKMAGLGELTAGIAHEIQNPLNFVNNFADVSTELIDELKEGPLEKLPDDEREYAHDVMNDLTQNLQKIVFHGRRASGIVKSMLEHSRMSAGEWQQTNVNTLCDEYMRLAYHGLRAKDKAFNATLETHFDNNLPVVNMVPQDIGRVLLNLFNNAFYAVQKRQQRATHALNAYAYQPTVAVKTQKLPNGRVEIRIRDNGLGIPDAVKEKIFQPFFTTKPTGEGTGLGLSLSYDIVTKGHNGQIWVESTEGHGAEFIISLPATY